ncbi:hypothetical protein ABZ858_26580 [Streptomyces sp. NPDC047017]
MTDDSAPTSALSALDPDADRTTQRTMTAAIGVMALFFRPRP